MSAEQEWYEPPREPMPWASLRERWVEVAKSLACWMFCIGFATLAVGFREESQTGAAFASGVGSAIFGGLAWGMVVYIRERDKSVRE